MFSFGREDSPESLKDYFAKFSSLWSSEFSLREGFVLSNCVCVCVCLSNYFLWNLWLHGKEETPKELLKQRAPVSNTSMPEVVICVGNQSVMGFLLYILYRRLIMFMSYQWTLIRREHISMYLIIILLHLNIF